MHKTLVSRLNAAHPQPRSDSECNMAKVYLGLGSNIDSQYHLRLGIRQLRLHFGDLELSKIYRNAALGFNGADFLNMVVGLRSEEHTSELQLRRNLVCRHLLEKKNPHNPSSYLSFCIMSTTSA